MTKGNPTQVAALSIVAIGAIGFLGSSLFGMGKKVVSIGGETPAAEAAQKPEAVARGILAIDPFIHPKIADPAPKAPPTEPGRTTPPPQSGFDSTGVPPWNKFGFGPGTLPGSGDVKPTGPGGQEEAPPNPAEIAGASRHEEVAGPSFRLTAVIQVEGRVALISVGNIDSKSFRKGQLLAPGWRLLEITDSYVVIGNSRMALIADIGEEVQL